MHSVNVSISVPTQKIVVLFHDFHRKWTQKLNEKGLSPFIGILIHIHEVIFEMPTCW